MSEDYEVQVDLDDFRARYFPRNDPSACKTLFGLTIERLQALWFGLTGKKLTCET